MLPTALALALLIGTELNDQGATWHTDYGVAMSQLRQADKPLFVLFCARASQESYLRPQGSFLSTEVERTLNADYVTVVIDTDTRAGVALAAQFGVKIVPYCAIIDRSGRWQVSYQSGYPEADPMLAVLQQHRRTKLGVDRKPVLDVAEATGTDRPAVDQTTSASGTVKLASARQACVIDVGEADFESEVIERSKERPVVVDFAADWCGPCRRLGPTLEKLAHEHNGGLVLARINIDRSPNLANSYGVEAVPAVKVFRDGRPVEGFVGVLPETQLRPFLAALTRTSAESSIVQTARQDDDMSDLR